jgi:Histidine kinase-like ATPase domain
VHITVEHDFETGIAFINASGNLDAPGAIRLRRAVARVFAEHPHGVVIDLSEAALVAPRALDSVVALAGERTFIALGSSVSRAGSHAVFADGGHAAFPGRGHVVFPDRRRAVAAALSAAQPPLRARAYLPPGVDAPAAARRMVASACRRWGVDRLSADAQLIISELVTNAVTHAGSELEVVAAVEGGDMHLYVRDHDRSLPQLPASRLRAQTSHIGGLGLMLVESLASAWGTTFGAHGKTVWARLRLAGPGPAAGLAGAG